MNELKPAQDWVNAQNAINAAARLSNAELALAQQAATIAQLAALVNPPIPTPVPAPMPVVLWHGGMETGNLSEWSNGPTGDNTGNAMSTAVQAVAENIPPRTTPGVMKQAWLGPSGVAEASGTRMSRYPEIDKLARAGTKFDYTWWDFFPAPLSYGAGGWYNHWQIASADGTPGGFWPIWILEIDGAGMTTHLTWSPNGKAPAEGPHAGEAGARSYASPISIPVGQWVKFEAEITPRSDFTGALKMWLNGQVLYDFSSIKTQFPIGSQPRIAWVANNCYGNALTPVPFAHYVDDVTVSLGRMP